MSIVNDLPVVYQNKRTLIVDASSNSNFGIDHQFVLWDKVMGFEMGWLTDLPMVPSRDLLLTVSIQ